MFIVSCFRGYFELFCNIVDDQAQIDLMLIINVKEIEFHLSNKGVDSAKKITSYIDIWEEKFAQMIVIR